MVYPSDPRSQYRAEHVGSVLAGDGSARVPYWLITATVLGAVVVYQFVVPTVVFRGVMALGNILPAYSRILVQSALAPAEIVSVAVVVAALVLAVSRGSRSSADRSAAGSVRLSVAGALGASVLAVIIRASTRRFYGVGDNPVKIPSWPPAPYLTVLLGGFALWLLGYWVAVPMFWGGGFGSSAADAITQMIVFPVIIIVAVAARMTTRSATPPATHIGFTVDGRPVYPVVGYTSDGSPVRADQTVGYRPLSGRTNNLAVAAFIVSLVFSPAAIPLGHIARGQIRRSGEGGDGLALAGLIIGYISVALLMAYAITMLSILS